MPFAANGGIMDSKKMASGGIANTPSYYDTTKYVGLPTSAVDAINSGIAQLAPPTYNPVARQYVAAVPGAMPVAPAPNVVSNQGYSRYIPNATNMDGGGGSGDDGGGTVGPGVGAGGEGGEGEANGGLMQSYAMGGGIGQYDPSPDDGNSPHPPDMVGGHASVSMGPAYPMQGIKSSYAYGGGIYNLGGYSDGGRLLKGPGDGVSDDIPAQIGEHQPARLADGEFVIPARIVSELGNGSTDAGAKRLYAMMDRVQANRSKTVGKGKVAVDSKASKHLPA
jgi:hypothetical protein